MWGLKAIGRHAGPRTPRPVFNDPGDGRWRTDVVVFVLVPFALALLLGTSALAWLDGGPDRWRGFALVGTAAAVLVPPAWLRWRVLDTSRARRPLMLYYAFLGTAMTAGVLAALGR